MFGPGSYWPLAAGAFGRPTFVAMNAVWTSADGQPRFGTDFVQKSGLSQTLAGIPNPLLKDESEHLLPLLPPAVGWRKHDISDPWTTRPIALDGSLANDAQIQAILDGTDPDLRETVRTSWNVQKVTDPRASANGARRTGAAYTDGDRPHRDPHLGQRQRRGRPAPRHGTSGRASGRPCAGHRLAQTRLQAPTWRSCRFPLSSQGR